MIRADHADHAQDMIHNIADFEKTNNNYDLTVIVDISIFLQKLESDGIRLSTSMFKVSADPKLYVQLSPSIGMMI